jgi:hypothetical protein
MVAFHSRYNLGDKDHGYTSKDQSSWGELRAKLVEDGAVAILPVYMYEHSGITIRTTPFSCKWDSGQVGFIFVGKEKLLKEYGGKKVTKKKIDRALGVIKGEVETYDQYLCGEVYGFTVEDKDEKDIDSCGGFLGDYNDKDYGALHEARSAVDHELSRINNRTDEIAKAAASIDEPLIIGRNIICQKSIS